MLYQKFSYSVGIYIRMFYSKCGMYLVTKRIERTGWNEGGDLGGELQCCMDICIPRAE